MSRIIILIFTAWIIGPTIHAQVLFGGANDEEAYSILRTKDQGLLVVGTTRSFGLGSEDILLIKLNKLGLIEYYKTIGTSHRNRIYRTIQTRDGGYALLGSGFPEEKNISDIHLVKLDWRLEVEWESYYLNPSEEEGYGIQELADGYLISGFTRETGVGAFQIIKTNLSGDIIWSKIIGKQTKDIAIGSAILSNGNYLICGMKSGFNNYSSFDFKRRSSNLMFAELNKNTGDTVYTEVLQSGDHVLLNDVVQANDGSIYILGSDQNNSMGSFDVLLGKLDHNGTLLWTKTFGGSAFDYGSSLIIHNDSLFIVGTSNSFSDKPKIYCIHATLEGNPIWEKTYGSQASEYGKDIDIIGEHLYVLGQKMVEDSIPHSDVILYILDLNGADEQINLTESLKTKIQLYPIPAQNHLNVNVLKSNLDIEIDQLQYAIFDDQGKLVKQFSANKNFQLNTAGYRSGRYVLKVLSEEYSDIQKQFIIVH
ncbi:MAG: T9SS type A sorting domain-containing protein [Flavobacteriales bacterium]|nr:T9SS type A sorting domain-containing protein [Flavobacteriales bacterium]